MRRGGGGMDLTTHHNLEIAELKAMRDVTQQMTRAAEALARAAGRSGGGGGGLTLAGAAGGGGSLAGLVPELAQASAAAGIFAATLATAGRAVGQFVQTLATVGTVALSTGGSPGQAGALSATLAAAGIDADQIPGIAARVRSLRGGGRAAAELGFQPGRDVDPSLDELRGLADVVGQILDPMISAEDALAKARLSELEALLPLREVVKKHGGEMAQEAQLRASLADPAGISAAFEFNYQIGRIGRGFTDLASAAGQFLVPTLNFVSFGLDKVNDGLQALGTTVDWLAGILGFKSGGSSGASAANSHAQATRDNTAELRKFNQQFANGGPRSSRAIPAGLGAEALSHYLQGEYFRMGGLAP